MWGLSFNEAIVGYNYTLYPYSIFQTYTAFVLSSSWLNLKMFQSYELLLPFILNFGTLPSIGGNGDGEELQLSLVSQSFK